MIERIAFYTAVTLIGGIIGHLLGPWAAAAFIVPAITARNFS